MKIAIVTKNMGAGGTERVISQLLKEWSSIENVKCSLILLENNEDFYPIPEKVEVVRIGLCHDKPVINKFLLYKNVRKAVKRIGPDIVLSMPEEVGIYVIGALLGTKTKIVVSERNNPYLMPYKKITRFLRKCLYPFVNGFIFQTRQAADFFSTAVQKKSTILANPLELSRIPDPFSGTLKKIVVGVGRFETQKNFKLLIDAFSDFYINHSDYELLIYGEGSMKEELTEYAFQTLGENAFSFPGRNSNLLRDIQKCEIFVLSSDYEGSPNVLIEAMASGIAVISTDYTPGGVDTIIKNRVNGVIVNRNDRVHLAEQLDKLASDKEYAEKLRENAILIKNQFDSSVISIEWLDFLTQIANGR